MHTSYVSYKFAYEFEKNKYKTFEKFRSIYDFKCEITEDILTKIIEGAKISPFLQKRFKKYFE